MVDELPSLSGVVAPVNSAIRSGEHAIRILGIDPHRVEISMNTARTLGRKSFPAILRIKHLRAELPDAEIIIGVDANLAVIRRPRIGIAHLLPGITFILAAISSALLVLNDGVNDVGILAVNVQSDTAGVPAIVY